MEGDPAIRGRVPEKTRDSDEPRGLDFTDAAESQTSASAFGSFGSWRGRVSLSRSSRFTPSHIASAAATNADE